MPQIPRFTPQLVPQDKANPGSAARVGLSLARSGERIRQVGEHIGAVEDAMQRAARSVKALELESLINNKLDDYAATYKDRTDSDNFEKDAENQVEEIRREYTKEIGDDKKLLEAVDITFGNKSSDFLRAIRSKRAEVITLRARGTLQEMINKEHDIYAATTSVEERAESKGRVFAKAKELAETRAISFAEAENIKQAFDDTAEAVRADKIIEDAPQEFLDLLKEGSFDDLPPKTKQSLKEKANRRVKQLESEEQIRDNEAKKVIKAEQEKVTLGLLQEINTLTFKQINDADTNVEDQQMLTNKVQARADKIETQNIAKAKAATARQEKLKKEIDKAKKAEAKEKGKKELEAARKDFILRFDELTAEDVRQSILPATGPASIESFLKAIKERDEPVDDITEESDAKSLSDMKKQINTNPAGVTERQIMEPAGGGDWTVDQAEGMIKDWQDRLEDTPRGQNIKSAHTYIEDVYDLGAFGDKEEIESLDKKNDMVNAFNAYLLTDEGKKDKDPTKWLKNELNPDVRGFWGTILNAPGEVVYDLLNPIEQNQIPQRPQSETGGPIKLPTDQEAEDRAKAIKILTDAGQPVTEANIKFVMESN